MRPSGFFSVTKKDKISGEVASMRKQLQALAEDSSQPVPRRDIIRAALSLTRDFNPDMSSEREAMKSVYNYTSKALRYDDSRLDDLREILENLINTGCAAGDVTAKLEQALLSLEANLTPRPLNTPSSELEEVIEVKAQTATRAITYHHAPIYNDSKNVSVTVAKGGSDTRQFGHRIKVRPGRQLPAGNFSVHNREEGSTYTLNGTSNYHYGGTFEL